MNRFYRRDATLLGVLAAAPNCHCSLFRGIDLSTSRGYEEGQISHFSFCKRASSFCKRTFDFVFKERFYRKITFYFFLQNFVAKTLTRSSGYASISFPKDHETLFRFHRLLTRHFTFSTKYSILFFVTQKKV